jgi:uncharacterized protein YegL
MTKNNLYEQVVDITYTYLGPAADRFVVRQIRNHLQKDPEELQRQDLRQLMDWIELAMHLISNDTRTIHDYMTNLEVLIQPDRQTHYGKTDR